MDGQLKKQKNLHSKIGKISSQITAIEVERTQLANRLEKETKVNAYSVPSERIGYKEKIKDDIARLNALNEEVIRYTSRLQNALRNLRKTDKTLSKRGGSRRTRKQRRA